MLNNPQSIEYIKQILVSQNNVYYAQNKLRFGSRYNTLGGMIFLKYGARFIFHQKRFLTLHNSETMAFLRKVHLFYGIWLVAYMEPIKQSFLTLQSDKILSCNNN